MPKTMKAAVVREFGKPLLIAEVAVPEVGPGQILVKVAAAGVCHTDLHAVDGDWPVKPKPFGRRRPNSCIRPAYLRCRPLQPKS